MKEGGEGIFEDDKLGDSIPRNALTYLSENTWSPIPKISQLTKI